MNLGVESKVHSNKHLGPLKFNEYFLNLVFECIYVVKTVQKIWGKLPNI